VGKARQPCITTAGGDTTVNTSRRRLPPRRRRTMKQTLTAEQRGYGRNHRQVRRAMAKQVAAGGAVCHRCGRWINPAEPWHAGHRDDVPGAKARGIYAGPEHALCSHTSGGWKRQGVLQPPTPPRGTGLRPKALAFFDAPKDVAGDEDS
jgi:hypothetical protein